MDAYERHLTIENFLRHVKERGSILDATATEEESETYYELDAPIVEQLVLLLNEQSFTKAIQKMTREIAFYGTRDGRTGFPHKRNIPVDTALIHFVSELGFGATVLENSPTRMVVSAKVFSTTDDTYFNGSPESMRVLHEALVYWNDITQPVEHTQRLDMPPISNIPLQWAVHANKVHFITFLAAGLRSDDISYLLNQWKQIPLEDMLAAVRLAQETGTEIQTVVEEMFGNPEN